MIKKISVQEWRDKMGTKILVVDDDVNICDLLRLYFENEG